jgi:cytochrome P450
MLPPGPQGHFLVGSLPEFRRDVLGFFAACARQYGDVVPLRVPRRRLVLLSHPDLIEEVLTTHARRTTKTVLLNMLGPVLGNGLLLLATIAQRFRFRLAPGASVKPMLSVTLRPADGISMILSAR